MRAFLRQFLQSDCCGARAEAVEANNAVCRFARETYGQDLIEYALLAALVGLGSVSGMKGLSGQIANSFSNINSSITNAVTAPASGGGHSDDH